MALPHALPELPDSEIRLLARLARTQPWVAAAGLALALMGAAYATWGVLRFDPRADPREDPGFDRPVAQLAFLYQGYQSGVERIAPETSTEAVLRSTLLGGMHFGSGVVLMLLRLFLGTLLALVGCVMMTVVVERRRLLKIIGRLQA